MTGLLYSKCVSMCEDCLHRNVCMYEKIYNKILNAMASAIVADYTPDQQTVLNRADEYAFIDSISAKCKYYENWTNPYYTGIRKVPYYGQRLGKTSRLIEESAKTGAIIVVPTYSMSVNTLWLAEQLGLHIPEPITVTNYIYTLAKGGLGKTQKYLIDELQMVLKEMNVEAATVNP